MDSTLRIKGLLLDMDGLLLDTERVAEQAWKEAEEETGFIMPEGFYHSLIGQSMVRIEERLHEAMSPDCDVDAYLAAANRIYHDVVLGGLLPIKDGAAEFLEFITLRNIPRCLATSTFRELCDRKLETTGLGHWIPMRVTGDEVQHSKPAPDIYREAARKLDFPPAELLVLEDSENGLLAGLAAGCRVAHVPDIAPVSIAVQTKADRVFKNLAEVTAALLRDEIVIY